MFPASDDDAWELIKGVIAESDYYLLVIGGKYGSIDSHTNLSFTEKEYDHRCGDTDPSCRSGFGDTKLARGTIEPYCQTAAENFGDFLEGSYDCPNSSCFKARNCGLARVHVCG